MSEENHTENYGKTFKKALHIKRPCKGSAWLWPWKEETSGMDPGGSWEQVI
jgi:hypothetical protein